MKKLFLLSILTLISQITFAETLPIIFNFDTSRLEGLKSPFTGAPVKSLFFEYGGNFCHSDLPCDKFKAYFENRIDIIKHSSVTLAVNASILELFPDDFFGNFSDSSGASINNSRYEYFPGQPSLYGIVAPIKEPCNLIYKSNGDWSKKTYKPGTYNIVLDTEPKYFEGSNKPVGYWLTCEVTKQ